RLGGERAPERVRFSRSAGASYKALETAIDRWTMPAPVITLGVPDARRSRFARAVPSGGRAALHGEEIPAPRHEVAAPSGRRAARAPSAPFPRLRARRRARPRPSGTARARRRAARGAGERVLRRHLRDRGRASGGPAPLRDRPRRVERRDAARAPLVPAARRRPFPRPPAP